MPTQPFKIMHSFHKLVQFLHEREEIFQDKQFCSNKWSKLTKLHAGKYLAKTYKQFPFYGFI